MNFLHSETHTKSLAALMLFGAAFFWATTFIFSKVLVSYLSVEAMLLVRTIITCVILYFIFFKKINSEFFLALKDKDIIAFSLVGTVALFLQTESLRYTTASNCAFISSFMVILAPVIKFIHFKAHFKKMFFLAIILSVSGIYLISYGIRVPTNISIGDLLALISSVCYAYFIVILESVSQKFSSATITYFYFFILLICSLIITIFTYTPDIFRVLLIPSVSINLAGLAILGGIIPYMLMAEGQKYILAHEAGLIYNFEAVFAAILSIIILGESLNLIKIAGCIIIFISLVIGSRNS